MGGVTDRPRSREPHTRKYWDELQAGTISEKDWFELETHGARTTGTCNTMGIASTMTSITDALGMTLRGATSIPPVDSGYEQMASECGSRIVEMVWEDLKPRDILTPDAFHNGLVAYMALGGSTNAAVHRSAMAHRAGVALTLDDMNEMAGKILVLANLFPSGDRLMEDFFFAGGLRALLNKVRDHLELDAVTANGRTIGEFIDGAACYDADVIRDFDNPVVPLERGRTLALLRGSAPGSCQPGSCQPGPRGLRLRLSDRHRVGTRG